VVDTATSGPFKHLVPTRGGVSIVLSGTSLGPSAGLVAVYWDGRRLDSVNMAVCVWAMRWSCTAMIRSRPALHFVAYAGSGYLWGFVRSCARVRIWLMLVGVPLLRACVPSQVPHSSLVFVSPEGAGPRVNLSLVVAGVVADLGWGADPAQGLSFEPPSITALDVLPASRAEDVMIGLDCSRATPDGFPVSAGALSTVTLLVSGALQLCS
jgi:hypothetical protein